MTDTAVNRTAPLIELRNVRKMYGTDGEAAVEVLRGVSLSINAGEFIAIIGVSGSGKSTLMSILGCLDRPTSGQYFFAGRDVAGCNQDELSQLRREAFGFIFQHYHLIPTITAMENVEVPAMYAGLGPTLRQARAEGLLKRLGLGERLHHRPNQLSGGQQQRVSIARALMNGGGVLLADEPTGALDSQSGAEVMTLLIDLAAQGHTVILITHDRTVANAAHRIIEIRDGCIVADNHTTSVPAPSGFPGLRAAAEDVGASLYADMREAIKAARGALSANVFRTGLTLLGIVIGVASVIALLAIGEGVKQTVLSQMAIFGANRLYVLPGGESQRGPGGTLSESDADVVRNVSNVSAAMPYLSSQVTVRYGNTDYQTNGGAVTTDFPHILNWSLQRGMFFTADDERRLATVAIIGQKLKNILFPDGADPLQKFVLVNNVPFQVIGVLAEKGSVSGNDDDDDTIIFPFSTGSNRVYGRTTLSWISVLVADRVRADDTVDAITKILVEKHRVKDFRIINQIAAIQAETQTQNTLTLLLGFTAAISLLVGGIGVMNIMLMTVSERTREIGIRIATGARTRDILRQFLTEAALVASMGGCAGVGLGLLTGCLVGLFVMPVVFSLTAIIGAFGCAILTGLVFGYMPAHRAARLEPVVALARE